MSAPREHAQEDEVPRCQYVTPTPWGLAQCALPEGHEERHAYSPSEALDGSDWEPLSDD